MIGDEVSVCLVPTITQFVGDWCSIVSVLRQILIMGILRIYLALVVVAAHSGATFPWIYHNAREAVQIFYLISGFYMAHISSKYKSPIEFYSSRFIRIYTPYFSILIVVIMVSLISGILFDFWGSLEPFLSQSDENGAAGIMVATISNISLFFQDWVMFLKDDSGMGLSIATNFYESSAPLYNYLLIPQAWTVGIELTFYLFVPFLNRRKSRTLFGILLLSLLLRVFVYEYYGLINDPWNYRFFPFELAIFILGILSNRLYVLIKNSKFVSSVPTLKTARSYFVGTCLMLICIYALGNLTSFLFYYVGPTYTELSSYLAWTFMIPIVFIVFENIRIDRYVGDLSYPVYLGHVFVIVYLRKIINALGSGIENLGILSIIITILFSIILYKYILLPVDRNRYKSARNIASKVKQSKFYVAMSRKSR